MNDLELKKRPFNLKEIQAGLKRLSKNASKNIPNFRPSKKPPQEKSKLVKDVQENLL